jgi:hypothetical protein
MAVEATADPLGGRHCYNPKVRCVGTYLVTTFTLMCCLLMGILKPFHNWDMIGYTAAAYHADGFRGKDLSDRTYSAIKDEVTPEKFAYLTQSDHYKKTVFENPSSLEQQIPFYSIRVIYVRLVQSLGRMGMAYPRATYVLAAVFSAASVVVLSVLFAKLGVTIAALPVVVFISSFVAIARNSTPGLACLFPFSVGLARRPKRRAPDGLSNSCLAASCADRLCDPKCPPDVFHFFAKQVGVDWCACLRGLGLRDDQPLHRELRLACDNQLLASVSSISSEHAHFN